MRKKKKRERRVENGTNEDGKRWRNKKNDWKELEEKRRRVCY